MAHSQKLDTEHELLHKVLASEKPAKCCFGVCKGLPAVFVRRVQRRKPLFACESCLTGLHISMAKLFVRIKD